MPTRAPRKIRYFRASIAEPPSSSTVFIPPSIIASPSPPYLVIPNKISFLSFPFLASRRQQRSKRRDSSPSDVSRVTPTVYTCEQFAFEPDANKERARTLVSFALDPFDKLRSFSLSLSPTVRSRSLVGWRGGRVRRSSRVEEEGTGEKEGG